MASSAASLRAFKEALQYWDNFVRQCLRKRLDVDRFVGFVQLVYAKHPLQPFLIADFFLRPQSQTSYTVDPRIPLYIQKLGQLKYVDAPAILKALYIHSALHSRVSNPEQDANKESSEKKKHKPSKWKCSSWAEEVIFYQVIKSVVEGTAFKDVKGALDLVSVICQWMNLFVSASAADLVNETQDFQWREEMETARAAFVPLLLRLTDNLALIQALEKPFAKNIRKQLSSSMGNFVQTLQPVPQIIEKLELFRTETLGRMDPKDKKKASITNAAMEELLDSTVGLDSIVIPEVPIATTRSGLYIYLNALLVGRPLVDDAMLISYLNNRYQGNTQSSAIDLILASFDILANTVFRNEAPKDAHLLKSFLINKIPLLLAQLCPPEFSTTSVEFCITEAINQVDTSVFPTASLMFDESRNNNPYTESVREEFVAACALHGLVAREHVDRILGETSMSYEPSLEKASKDKLVQDCLADPEKIQGLTREIEKMDGNVGAVSQALVEVMRQLCTNKETMSLKLLCSQLVQKPQLLDVMLLFERLPTLVGPLCNLLDNWKYEEDQGEYQPVYEEFGAVLLLVLAFVYRYRLTAVDLGIQSSDSLVGKIITRSHVARPISELTEQDKSHLNGWIQGLFDSEAGGLGDDLMSSCPPGDFYLLIATIFQNMVVAYSCGYLNQDSLKSGVEYLVDTFLLPSLAPAMLFLADYIWVDQKEQKSIVKILHLLLSPSSISGEASAVLSSVKTLVAAPLEHALQAYQKQDPRNQEIEPLLNMLKDSVPFSRRTGSSQQTELQSWASSSSTGLTGAVRHTIQGLVQWSIQPNMSAMPATYTHRQILAEIRIAGSRKLLTVILEELRNQTLAGTANIGYDVAIALICAPDVTSQPPPLIMDATGAFPAPPQKPMNLREILKDEAQDYKKLQKKDPALAEMILRLHRRVEAMMIMPEPQAILQPDMALNLNAGTADLGDTSLGDAMAAAAAAAGTGDAMSMDTSALDLNLGGPEGADGDLFGLDTSMDVFDGWDTMDLGN